MAVSKLSQIASGSAVNTSTDTIVTVRSGTTDVLTTLGALAAKTTIDTADITANAVTYPKIQATTQAALLGASSATTVGEITLGTNLTFSGSVLNASSTASTAFSAITGSTNTTAAMVIGTGASIAATGSGSITATAATAGSITGAMISGTGAERSFGINILGGGSTIPTGATSMPITVNFTGTIDRWYLVADQSGSAVVDIKRSGTSIVGGGNLPTLSSAISGNAAPSGWTSTAVTAGDIFTFNVNSATSIANLNLMVSVKVT